MSSDRRIRSSRANGALSRGPKTEAGKNRSRLNGVKHGIFAKTTILNNESPLFFTKLRNKYYEFLQPANPIERDLVDEMVMSRWFCRRVWRLENSTINHKMDEKAAVSAARHARLMERSHTSIACQTICDKGHALKNIQRSQARNSPMHPRPQDGLHDLRRDQKRKNEQTKGDDRFWPPPEMKMGGVQSIAGLEKAAVIGNGDAVCPENETSQVDVKHPRMEQLSRGRTYSKKTSTVLQSTYHLGERT